MGRREFTALFMSVSKLSGLSRLWPFVFGMSFGTQSPLNRLSSTLAGSVPKRGVFGTNLFSYLLTSGLLKNFEDYFLLRTVRSLQAVPE